MELLSVDWVGLTADFLVGYTEETCIVVDPDGQAALEIIGVADVVTLDLVEEAMERGGEAMLQELLDYRRLELLRIELDQAIDEYVERWG
jgi:hypothetical protein